MGTYTLMHTPIHRHTTENKSLKKMRAIKFEGDEEPYSCCEEAPVGKEVPSKTGAGTPPTDPQGDTLAWP